MPLLSVVIPTKNRYQTALVAVRTILANKWPEFELIVHDCSDNSRLSDGLAALPVDSRLKYYHICESLSMTQNWNLAASKITGDYVVFIGDDDTILPNIMAVAKWAKQNHVDALQGRPAEFFWSSFPIEQKKGLLQYWPIKNAFRWNNEVKQSYENLFKVNYRGALPNPYHGLISKRVYDEVFRIGKAWYATTTPDCYFLYVASMVLDKIVICDFPFTISGASLTSNSGRLFTGKRHQHFVEYKETAVSIPFPNIVEFQLANNSKAFLETLQMVGRSEAIRRFDIDRMYAACLLSKKPIRVHVDTIRQYFTLRHQLKPLWALWLFWKIIGFVPIKLRIIIGSIRRIVNIRSERCRVGTIEQAIEHLKVKLPIMEECND